MIPISIEIQLPNLPFWQGSQPAPGGLRTLPFSLGWSENGFVSQTTPTSVRQEVVEAYATDTYEFITPPPGASNWASALGDQQISFITKTCRDIEPRSVLEIGAGSHYVAQCLLKLLQPQAYTIVDPSVRTEDSRIEVIADYFPSARLQTRTFDLVLAFNSLEHVHDPLAFLCGIRASLTPNGIVALCLPDVERQFAAGDLNALLHEHISYFTQGSLVRLAAAAGLQIAAISSVDDTLWAIARASTREVTAEPPDEILYAAATNLRRELGRAADEIRRAMLAGSVAFHGATNGLNNFLCLSGLAGSSQVVVFDGDDLKAGRYLPTCPNPIRSSSDPEYRRFGRVYVSALTYFEPIRRFACDQHGLAGDAIVPLFAADRCRTVVVR